MTQGPVEMASRAITEEDLKEAERAYEAARDRLAELRMLFRLARRKTASMDEQNRQIGNDSVNPRGTK